MANHKSSLKRIRQDKNYPKVQKMLDKLAKTNIIHKNKAANLKSSLSQHINKLG